jgi:hypothetical protein
MACPSFGAVCHIRSCDDDPLYALLPHQARQYFQEGFYPTGAKRAAHKFDPSGALIKAVIIGGATPLAVRPQ